MKKTLSNRLEAFQAALDAEKLRGLILSQSAYVYHLTNWLPPSWANIFVVVGPSDLVLVTPLIPKDIEPIWSEVIIYESFGLEALEQALTKLKLVDQTVGAILDSFPAAYALPLSNRIQLQEAGELVHSVTAVKDEVAQNEIRKRVGYLDKAFEVAKKEIRPGVSEIEVFGTIFTSLAQSLGGPFTLDCNFGSGPRALVEEPQPTGKLIVDGEVVMIDLFPNMGGYVADYTRNFVVGKPTDGQLAQHEVLEKALAAAEGSLRPGVKVSDIDQLVRKVIEDEGYGEFAYQHHTGHAFGLTIPEPPLLIAEDHTPLQAGMVIAVEPGIYHPVYGGMRLEGNYIITENGCEPLVGFPAKLIVCE